MTHKVSQILETRVAMFKRGMYDFIISKDDKKHEKQGQVLRILNDKEHVEILYGGAAGGAKSWTGCVNLVFNSLAFPGTKWFIGRETLKRLRESTLITLFKVCKEYGINPGDYIYNGQDHFIKFYNDSRIDLLDLCYLPSDPLYERYGSVEYSGGWIEEGGEVNFGAYDTLKTRIGRHLNDKYGLLRKMFITCNPKKNWLYTAFYKPSVRGTLGSYMYYLPSLVNENPFIESDYISALDSTTDKARKERLLYGNWDYDDDPSALCDFDAISDALTNTAKQSNKKAISADLAMQGRDRFIAGYWEGLKVEIAIDKEKSTGKSIENDLRNLMSTKGVGRSQTIADSDGLGAYLESYLNGIKAFHAGARAFDDMYASLKDECAYKLAETINKRELQIVCTKEQENRLLEELPMLMRANVDDDKGRKKIISKEIMKEKIQRSPDMLDMLIMGMYPHVSKSIITNPKTYKEDGE